MVKLIGSVSYSYSCYLFWSKLLSVNLTSAICHDRNIKSFIVVCSFHVGVSPSLSLMSDPSISKDHTLVICYQCSVISPQGTDRNCVCLLSDCQSGCHQAGIIFLRSRRGRGEEEDDDDRICSRKWKKLIRAWPSTRLSTLKFEKF